MDPLQLLHSTVSALADSSHLNGTLVHVAGNTTLPTASPMSPTALFNPASILSLLMNISVLRDWLKIIVLGGVIETCRRLFFGWWQSLKASFWVTARLDQYDMSYSKIPATRLVP